MYMLLSLWMAAQGGGVVPGKSLANAACRLRVTCMRLPGTCAPDTLITSPDNPDKYNLNQRCVPRARRVHAACACAASKASAYILLKKNLFSGVSTLQVKGAMTGVACLW